MKLAIMQPYFLPYIGYFQLIQSVDFFVIYDNIQYTKKGWINRNRFLVNGSGEYFSLPLKKGSSQLNIVDRYLSDEKKRHVSHIKNKIQALYAKAPYFDCVFPLLETIFSNKEENLFYYLKFSLEEVLKFLEIHTTLLISSTIDINHSLKGQDKVLAICKSLKATNYINPIGGVDLYSEDVFNKNGIQLNFLKSNALFYKQFNHDFIPWLSILDVLMFNSIGNVKDYLKSYTLK